MHPPILEARGLPRRVLSSVGVGATCAGLLASGLAMAAGAPPVKGLEANCPAAATAVVEHFLGADCTDCWKAAPAAVGGAPPVPGAAAPGPTEWSLDWILPQADTAPMAPGALPEAADRLARLGPRLPALMEAAPAGFDTTSELAPPDKAHRFYVHSSLPQDGYFGVQMHARGTWAAGSTAWIALVELMPVGTRDTAIPRRLVRALVGPVKLPTGPGEKDAVAPLFALRWPENAHPEYITATAWVEGRDGRIVQIATDRCTTPK